MSEDYSPYCSICSGCGEGGCCSALHCQQHPDGSYCKTYLQDLKHAYMMNEWWWEKVYDILSPELKAECDAEFDRAFDICYKENLES